MTSNEPTNQFDRGSITGLLKAIDGLSEWGGKITSIFDLVITGFLFYFFTGVLVWQSALWFWEAYADKLTSGTIWDPPIWPMRLFILIGAVMLMLSGVAQSIRDILIVMGREQGKSTAGDRV